MDKDYTLQVSTNIRGITLGLFYYITELIRRVKVLEGDKPTNEQFMKNLENDALYGTEKVFKLTAEYVALIGADPSKLPSPTQIMEGIQKEIQKEKDIKELEKMMEL